jgi:hypothetical protein
MRNNNGPRVATVPHASVEPGAPNEPRQEQSVSALAYEIIAPDLTAKEGWIEFASRKLSTPPTLPGPAARSTMTPGGREGFDARRMAHHATFGPILTPQLERVHAALTHQVTANLHCALPGARRGSILDGYGSLGKTTALLEFGRRYQRAMRKHFPGGVTPAGDEFVPVVYLSVPANTSIKGLNRHFLAFYGVTTPQSRTTDHMTLDIVRLARRCGTTLVLVDDVHFLPMRQETGRVLNDHLKHLANSIAATFVLAGIGLEEGGLLTEGKRPGTEATSQTRSRFTLHRMEAFATQTPTGQAEWHALLKAIESELVLLDARPQMLTGLASYLYERTAGVIGSLMALVRAGANLAITSGAERLTKHVLDQIPLDYHAERERVRRTGRSTAPPAPGALSVDRAVQLVARVRRAAAL